MSLRQSFTLQTRRAGVAIGAVAAVAAIAIGTTTVNAGASAVQPKCFWGIGGGTSEVHAACGSRITTDASLSSSLNPATEGQEVTFSASIAPTSGSGTPTGSVTFSTIDPVTQHLTARDTSLLGNGTATWVVDNLPAGTDGVNVSYSGDAVYAKTSATMDEQVTPAPPAPIVSSISPKKGPAAGGFPVTVTGANFDSLTSVAIGSVHTTSYSCPTSTTCFVFMPPGTGSQHITMTNVGGTSKTGTADRFKYV